MRRIGSYFVLLGVCVALAGNANTTLFPAQSHISECDRSFQAMSAHSMNTQAISSFPSDYTDAGIRRRVPQDHAKIQVAIDACNNGDTVLVSEGTYYENIRYNGKAVVVGSLFLIDGDTAHIARTIIDGSNPANGDSASVVAFSNGEDSTSVLCGFTITGGTGTKTYFDSAWYRFGGGILCHNSGARIIDNIITRNIVRCNGVYGGGMFTYTEASSLPFVILERNRFIGNHVRADSSTLLGSGGGGAVLSGVHCRIIGNVFERDTVLGYNVTGGGLIVSATPPEFSHPLPRALVSGNVMRNNVVSTLTSGSATGGGMSVIWTNDVTIVDNLFESNGATCSDSGAQGGGLFVQDDTIGTFGRKLIKGNRFVSNRCDGVSQAYLCGAGIYLYCTCATLDGNEITENIGNSSGGGIGTWMSSFRIQNNIITRNSSPFYGGGLGVVSGVKGGAEQLVVNNTVWGNRALYGGGIAIAGIGANTILLNNIFWADTTTIYGGGEIYAFLNGVVGVHHCDVQGGWPGGGNINANPLFIPGDPMFNLSKGSPCIGYGIDSLQVDGIWYVAPMCDCDGHARPAPGHVQGPDIGAQEEQTITDVAISGASVPTRCGLEQNYPNPFNPSTVISYQLPVLSRVNLRVVDLLGREVALIVNEEKPPGSYTVTWDASNMPSGIYFCRIKVGDYFSTRKMVMLK